MKSALRDIGWIRVLAKPYLRGYRPRAERGGDLHGYWFDCPGARGTAGFFAGYLTSSEECAHLKALPPECLVFAFVRAGTALHKRIVRAPESLLRKTFGYIRWLTHRPPRFEFREDRDAVMVCHISMQEWPAEKHEHRSRNFFIETLAWLVRSGLVKKLAAEVKPRGRVKLTRQRSWQSLAKRCAKR